MNYTKILIISIASVAFAFGLILLMRKVQQNELEVEIQKKLMAKPQTVRGLIVDKLYKSPFETSHRLGKRTYYRNHEERFILVYTNNAGKSFAIDNNDFYSRFEKGDSILVTFNYIGSVDVSGLNFLNVEKIITPNNFNK